MCIAPPLGAEHTGARLWQAPQAHLAGKRSRPTAFCLRSPHTCDDKCAVSGAAWPIAERVVVAVVGTQGGGWGRPLGVVPVGRLVGGNGVRDVLPGIPNINRSLKLYQALSLFDEAPL